MDNLYGDLGVDKDATAAEIKKAYKSKAQKSHPDKNDGEDEEFKRIQLAYTILSNKDKRKRYDNGEDVSNKREPTIDDMAVSMIATLTEKYMIECDEYTDLIKLIKRELTCKVETTKEQIKHIKRVRDQIAKTMKRIHRKDGGDNLIGSVFASKIDSANNAISGFKNEIKIADIAQSMLDDYFCENKDRDEGPRMTTSEYVNGAKIEISTSWRST